jgi:predicted ATPase/transcriptional regulator with GAF, ATPase, and Fis domain
MDIPRYDVAQEVSRDDRFVVHRGRRRVDQGPVLLKTATRVPCTAADAVSLEHEFELLRELSIAGVPRAYDFVQREGGPCLVLEDQGLTPLRRLIESGRPELNSFFQIARALCEIVAELHRRDIVHGSLNPSAIWVSASQSAMQVMDFTLASGCSRQVRSSPAIHLGALAYASPEQTGRMNRATDYRTDFYSLGVTFYEIITGALPFKSGDSLELIHSHIAKTPLSPSELLPKVPEQVSRIVMKLLGKTPEDRYQSALGLSQDLQICQREWAERRSIAPFAPGQRDVSDRFLIPQKLYGRDREVGDLIEAFDRSGEGGTAMALVSGYSGIGKTSLIQELYKPIVRQRGYFIAGKFDQIVRNIPYGALIQGFRDLIRQLLTETEDRLSRWRSQLSDALGAGGGVLAEVIPEIELVLGRQQPPPPLGPAEAQNRFRYVFQSFVGALARREHPLVIFLDDLQWADAATLGLLQPLLTGQDIRFLLLIGAYRDNEVDARHPLMRTVSALESAGAPLRHIVLGPLQLPELTFLVRDTLHGQLADVEPLARVILQKTDGNPFFAIQFLKTLKQEGLLTFDYSQGRWTFSLEAIAAAAITDNVVDLMSRRIQRLSPKAQHTLTLAACIGSEFDAGRLAEVSEQQTSDAECDINEALQKGLVLPAAGAGGGYTFLHDRVHQAAYAMIPELQRRQVHLTLGRFLLARWDPGASEEKVFDIAQHFNHGSSLIDDAGERVKLALLNLSAGRKAKSQAAYQSALIYVQAGLHLLGEDHWNSDYNLMWELHIEEAECEYLTGQFSEAETCFDRLVTRARTSLEKARISHLRIVQCENMARYAAAVQYGREGLALFGVAFPNSAEGEQAAMEVELSHIHALLEGRTIHSLVELPPMQDPELRMVMNLLTTLWASAYLVGSQALTRLISARMVRLSLAHGNTEESAYGYVTHAITVGPVRGDYQSAYEWGRLALAVNERFNDKKRRAKVHQQFQAHVSLWRRPLETSIQHAREACQAGLETGDFTYAGYGALTETWAALLTNRDLERFVSDCSASIAVLEKIKMSSLVPPQTLIMNWVRALQGRTTDKLSLSDDSFQEETYLETYGTHPFSLTFYYVAKLSLYVTFGAYDRAFEAGQKARRVVQHLSGTIWPVLLDFFYGLTLAALYRDATEEQRRTYLTELTALRDSLGVLAENCAENFGCYSLLVHAEIDRISERGWEAMASYEEAIRCARAASRVWNEALANELYSRLWRERGNEAIAAHYLREASRIYERWGAAAKVRDLEETGGLAPETGVTDTVSVDIASVIKAARAIAGEIVLEDLLRRLLRITLENAGAQRVVFLDEKDGNLHVAAEGTVDSEDIRVLQSVRLDESPNLCRSVVRYSRKTGESVVIGDALRDERFSDDPYVRSARPKSILCVPVVHQGKLGGILYLENNLAADAFKADHIRVIQILSSQAAISLENARIYGAMKQEVARRRQAEEELRSALAEVETLKKRLEAENVYLQEEIRREHNFEEIIGNSPALLELLQKLEKVAPADSTVLICGETGTGKELVARAVHNRSRRRDRPLVKVNCGAISAGLVESELFGHTKGAFTGALERRTGRFELADGGTLFLDEVSELPLETQVKLLRVLQEGEFEPVGSSRTQRVDVRIIAATNRDLAEAVRAGRFRSDLFYRLNVFPLEVPPLRARRPDIPQLVMFFVSRFAKRFGKAVEGVSQDTMDQLVNYSWPGNIRELQNLIERAVVLSAGPVLALERDHLPPFAGNQAAGAQRDAAARAAIVRLVEPTSAGLEQAEPPTALEQVERRHILAVLEKAGWVIEGPGGAAKALNLHPNTLRSRMKKLGIQRARHAIS